MKWLLISLDFYGYPQRIKAHLERLGHTVILVQSDEYLGVFRLLKWFLGRFEWLPGIGTKIRRWRFEAVDRKMAAEMAQEPSKSIDRVLIIRGCGVGQLCGAEIRRLKRNPHLVDVLYLWDSLKNVAGSLVTESGLSIRTVTFDKVDAGADSLSYQRLFSSEIPIERREKKLFTTYVGSGNIERIVLLKKIRKILHRLNASYVFVSPTRSPLKSVLFRLYIGRDPNWQLESVSFEEALDLQLSSRTVLDLPDPAQTGATIRCIEMLEAGIPIITFSPFVAAYGDEEIRGCIEIFPSPEAFEQHIKAFDQPGRQPLEIFTSELEKKKSLWKPGTATMTIWMNQIMAQYCAVDKNRSDI